jgi:hypothetical protein
MRYGVVRQLMIRALSIGIVVLIPITTLEAAKLTSIEVPLYFVPNRGQAAAHVVYEVAAPFGNVAFTPSGISFHIVKHAAMDGHATSTVQRDTLRLAFLGANPETRLVATQLLTGRIHYYRGQDVAGWHPNIPTYGAVTYIDLYPGIDLSFTADGRGLKYEFHVHPGADPTQIQLAYDGIERLSLDDRGDLHIGTPLGELRDQVARVYQVVNGTEVDISAAFQLRSEIVGTATVFGYRVADYDPRYPLMIDPLLYASFLGGDKLDAGISIAVDAAEGYIYVTGRQGLWNAEGTDAFVTKLLPAATGAMDHVYTVILGGQRNDEGYDIAVDTAGHAYVVGQTASEDFPAMSVVGHAFDETFNGDVDVFIAELDASGNLQYATYFGGSGDESGDADAGGAYIAVDEERQVYIAARTTSAADFPVTPGAFDTTFDRGSEVFAAKLNFEGQGQADLVFATYLGGSTDASLIEEDSVCAFAVDAAHQIYVAGTTAARDFPTTEGAWQTTYGGGPSDAYVAKLSPAGEALLYASYIGGSGFEEVPGLGVHDPTGHIYLAGPTSSGEFADFTQNMDVFQPTLKGDDDAFILVLNPAGMGQADLVYLTYLGGGSDTSSVTEEAWDLVVDAAGTAYVTGWTNAFDFPTTEGAFDRQLNNDGVPSGPFDTWVARLNPVGAGQADLLFSTFLGGSGAERGLGIVTDPMGNIYVTGETRSPDFPTTDGAFHATCGTDSHCDGTGDAFVVKIAPEPCTLGLSLHYGDETLTMDVVLGMREPMDFRLWLYAQGDAIPLGRTISLPTSDPPQPCSLELPMIPALGTIGVLATLVRSAQGIACSQFVTVDTGSLETDSPTAQELREQFKHQPMDTRSCF